MNARSRMLHEAEKLVNGDRNNAYGPPDRDFQRTADLWTIYLDGKRIIDPHDVAVMMILLKVSRLSWSPDKPDNWIDIAGYAACGYDIITRNTNPTPA